MDKIELKNRFAYHAPKDDQPEKYTTLRSKGLELAQLIVDTVPESREQALALTKIEEAIMWANAGIARRS